MYSINPEEQQPVVKETLTFPDSIVSTVKTVTKLAKALNIENIEWPETVRKVRRGSPLDKDNKDVNVSSGDFLVGNHKYHIEYLAIPEKRDEEDPTIVLTVITNIKDKDGNSAAERAYTFKRDSENHITITSNLDTEEKHQGKGFGSSLLAISDIIIMKSIAAAQPFFDGMTIEAAIYNRSILNSQMPTEEARSLRENWTSSAITKFLRGYQLVEDATDEFRKVYQVGNLPQQDQL